MIHFLSPRVAKNDTHTGSGINFITTWSKIMNITHNQKHEELDETPETKETRVNEESYC